MKNKLAEFISTAGGFGYCPVASGTAGTAVALPIAYLLLHAPVIFQLAALIILYPIFVWAAGVSNGIFGEHDAGEIVCDEVLGFLVTVIAMPPDSNHLGLGFLLFRFFDVLKPFPASYIDKNMRGGRGVVLDDVVAGIYAHIVLRIIF